MNASSSSNLQSSAFQRTVAAVIELEGPGLLTGEHCRLRLLPAEPGTGRVFVRTDLEPAVQIGREGSRRIVDRDSSTETLSFSCKNQFFVGEL